MLTFYNRNWLIFTMNTGTKGDDDHSLEEHGDNLHRAHELRRHLPHCWPLS